MSNVRVVCGFSGSAVRAAWFDALVFLIRCESLLQAHSLSLPLSLLLSSCSHQSPEAAAAPGQAQQFIYYATALRQRVQNFKLKVHACECDGNKNFFISVCGISATRNGQHWQDWQPTQMGITLAANLANLCGKQRNLKSANICDNWQGAPSMYVCVYACVIAYVYMCVCCLIVAVNVDVLNATCMINCLMHVNILCTAWHESTKMKTKNLFEHEMHLRFAFITRIRSLRNESPKTH